MRAIEFENQTLLMKPPEGHNPDDYECGSLPVQIIRYSGCVSYRSYWKPNAEDLKILNAGGYIGVDCINGQPPINVMVGSKEEIGELP